VALTVLSSGGGIEESMRTHRAPLAVVLLAALAGIGAGGTERPAPAQSYQAIELYTEAMTIIHDRYVDELSWSKIVQDGIRGAVQGLDADSTVREAPPPEARASSASADGDVGLALTRRGGGLSVVAAREGAPAQAAGIRSGDRIVTIGGEAVGAMATDAALRRLHGRPGSRLELTVIRSGWTEPRPFALTRVKLAPLDPSSRSLGDGVLYARMPRLDRAAAAELARLLAATPPERATGLVLDLRDTAGGRIEAVPAVASLFLDPGCVLARIEGRAPELPGVLTTTATTTRWTRPLAILVSHGTTSAAEVLAGALQDARRAVIVGSPTFGDASTQSAIPLSDGSTLSLTTARYLTPGRHPITGHGIAPDVLAEGAAPVPGASAAADPGLELAFEVVKAAGILEHGASGGGAPPAEAALGRCVIPAA
jgi:carboxyl-terminal processing protease